MTQTSFIAGVLSVLLSTSALALDAGTPFETACPFGDCEAGISLSYIGEFSLPTGQMFDGVEFGGISGLDYDPSSGHFLALSDDRSEKAPARFYELAIDVDATALHSVSVLKTVTLKDTNGQPFAAKSVDPESLRLGADGLFWSSEGDAKAGLAPFVRVAGRDGGFVRELPALAMVAPSADKTTGIRNNNAFEAMTFLPSGDLLVALEAALYQDGPAASLVNGSLARMFRYDAKSGAVTAQYVYPIEPIPQAPERADGWNDNGLPEILALDDHRALAIERSFAQDFGSSIKLFMIDLQGGTDVSQIASLVAGDARVVPVRKSQILDLRAMGLVPDNIEAMTFAKAKDGSELLVLASDNNFNGEQKTQFVAFKVVKRPH